MTVEVLVMLRYLARTATRLVGRSAQEPIAHDDLQHTHWDRASRQWVAHDDAGDLARAA